MYKRTKYKIPFYPSYINGCEYFRANVKEYEETNYHNDHEAFLVHYEDWLEAQGAHFHRRSPYMKQNHNIFFDTDEQRVIFLLKVSR